MLPVLVASTYKVSVGDEKLDYFFIFICALTAIHVKIWTWDLYEALKPAAVPIAEEYK